MKTKYRILTLAAVASFLAVPAFAQSAAGLQPAYSTGYAGIVELLAPVVAFGVTALLRHVAHVPSYLLPLIAATAGAGLAYVTSLLGMADISFLKGVVLGLAATGLHQIKVQIQARLAE